MKPTSIKKQGTDVLAIAWPNGHTGRYTFRQLRDACPCAGCAGESVLLREYKPGPADTQMPGRYELKGIEQVGAYAIQVSWGDGHATGIYTWEYLLHHCMCDACVAARGASPS